MEKHEINVNFYYLDVKADKETIEEEIKITFCVNGAKNADELSARIKNSLFKAAQHVDERVASGIKSGEIKL